MSSYWSLESTNLNFFSTSWCIFVDMYNGKVSQENMAALVLAIRRGYLLDDLVTWCFGSIKGYMWSDLHSMEAPGVKSLSFCQLAVIVLWFQALPAGRTSSYMGLGNSPSMLAVWCRRLFFWYEVIFQGKNNRFLPWKIIVLLMEKTHHHK